MTTSYKNEFSISIVLGFGWLVLVGMVYLFVIPTVDHGDDQDMQSANKDEEAAIVARIRPVITLADIKGDSKVDAGLVQTKAMPASAAKSPKDLYEGACLACHGIGVAGAPKLGDVAAWEARYANGFDAMLNTVKTGKGAMPPNGGSSYSEQEIRSVVDYMLSEAGLQESPSALVPSALVPSAQAAMVVDSTEQIETVKNEQTSLNVVAGEEAYRGACFVCHDAGVAGAPKLGDKAAWTVRLENGFDAMMKIALSGKGAMPPKGGANHLSDAEIANIVAFMAEEVK